MLFNSKKQIKTNTKKNCKNDMPQKKLETLEVHIKKVFPGIFMPLYEFDLCIRTI